MINYKLITTIVLVQFGLILVSFKIPAFMGLNKNDVTIEHVDFESELEVIPTKAYKDLILSKNHKEDNGSYVLNYHYPFLNETKNSANVIFNEYIKSNFLENSKSDKVDSNFGFLQCEIDLSNEAKEKSFLDYKEYFKNEALVSILLFKRDYHGTNENASYSFKALNYDINDAKFLDYNSVFKKDKESEIIALINRNLTNKFSQLDCWHLTESQFEVSKNNFTMSDNSIKFYFDDCTICPSYAGEYAVEILNEDIVKYVYKDDIKLRMIK